MGGFCHCWRRLCCASLLATNIVEWWNLFVLVFWHLPFWQINHSVSCGLSHQASDIRINNCIFPLSQALCTWMVWICGKTFNRQFIVLTRYQFAVQNWHYFLILCWIRIFQMAHYIVWIGMIFAMTGTNKTLKEAPFQPITNSEIIEKWWESSCGWQFSTYILHWWLDSFEYGFLFLFPIVFTSVQSYYKHSADVESKPE